MRFLLIVAVFLALAGKAAAAYQEPSLNAVASTVAGHPVIASCAASSAEWAQFETTAGLSFEADGFTFPQRESVIYLAPRICQTLISLVRYGPSDLGTYWPALAIKTLIHESVHQRGVLAENVTDCTALSLVSQYAVSSFGYAATIKRVSYVRKGVLYKRVTKTVPNPALARLTYWALQWHLAMPPNYQGGC